MHGLRLAVVTTGLLSAVFLLPATSANGREAARAERPPAKIQTLFRCRTDRRFKLQLSGVGTPEQGYALKAPQAFRGSIRLTLDVDTRTMTLLVRSAGGSEQSFVLKNVEQGSSPFSGAGGQADTAIRGNSGGNVFTLFAGYYGNGAESDAGLQVEGHRVYFLRCAGGRYSDPQVKGVGSHGSTNIFVLHAAGVAKEMINLPNDPGSVF